MMRIMTQSSICRIVYWIAIFREWLRRYPDVYKIKSTEFKGLLASSAQMGFMRGGSYLFWDLDWRSDIKIGVYGRSLYFWQVGYGNMFENLAKRCTHFVALIVIGF